MSDLLFYSASDEGRKLSNFYETPVYLNFKMQKAPVRFRNAETAYHCLKQKPLLTWRETSPFKNLRAKEARLLGKTIEIRPDWEEVKDRYMCKVLNAKFRNDLMLEYLLSTEERKLVHFAPWDSYWGTGRDGKGQNKLGLMLMEIRDEYS
jgi:ribA/ribD-fused uncharacterized protein